MWNRGQYSRGMRADNQTKIEQVGDTGNTLQAQRLIMYRVSIKSFPDRGKEEGGEKQGREIKRRTK